MRKDIPFSSLNECQETKVAQEHNVSLAEDLATALSLERETWEVSRVAAVG